MWLLGYAPSNSTSVFPIRAGDGETGPGERESRELNIGFFSRMERGLPWVRLKVAASLMAQLPGPLRVIEHYPPRPGHEQDDFAEIEYAGRADVKQLRELKLS